MIRDGQIIIMDRKKEIVHRRHLKLVEILKKHNKPNMFVERRKPLFRYALRIMGGENQAFTECKAHDGRFQTLQEPAPKNRLE